jgi:holo-[acyl-carrier protein] synthase
MGRDGQGHAAAAFLLSLVSAAADTTVRRLMDEPFELRVGLDVAVIADVAASIERFGDRYRLRLFTPHELGCCTGTPEVVAAGLAARFAAKEATLKVLRPTAVTPEWTTIEVRRTSGGWCTIGLTGGAARLAEESGIADLSVSFSHEAGLAIAIVVGVCRPGPGQAAN